MLYFPGNTIYGIEFKMIQKDDMSTTGEDIPGNVVEHDLRRM